MTRKVLSVKAVDPSRLVPKERGATAMPTVKPRIKKEKPAMSVEENAEFQKTRSKAMKKTHRRKLSFATSNAIKQVKTIYKSLHEAEKKTRKNNNRVRHLLNQHRSHLNPAEYPNCGECRLVLLDRNEKHYYYKAVWEITERTYQKDFSSVNPNNLTRGKDWHLDHKFSIAEGFRMNVDPLIIGSTCNLTMLDASSNISKKDNCSITLEELLAAYKD
jgi:hypothetical protein